MVQTNPSDILPPKASKTKSKKLRIELDGKQKGAQSTRVVFDDKGNAVDPPAFFIRQKGSSEQGGDEQGEEEEKIDKHALNQRWQQLKALMKERDRSDKAQLKQRLREKRKEQRRKALQSTRQEAEDKESSASDTGNDMEGDGSDDNDSDDNTTGWNKQAHS